MAACVLAHVAHIHVKPGDMVCVHMLCVCGGGGGGGALLVQGMEHSVDGPPRG